MKHPPARQSRLTLADLKSGEVGVIRRLEGDEVGCKRLMALGFISGKTITLETRAPLGDPKIYSILGYRISIPNNQARNIIITKSPSVPNPTSPIAKDLGSLPQTPLGGGSPPRSPQ